MLFYEKLRIFGRVESKEINCMRLIILCSDLKENGLLLIYLARKFSIPVELTCKSLFEAKQKYFFLKKFYA